MECAVAVQELDDEMLAEAGILTAEEAAQLSILTASIDAESESIERSFFAFSFPSRRARVLLERRG